MIDSNFIRELEDALAFVSVDGFDNEAYVCRETGRIYWISSDEGAIDEEPPADLTDNPDRYVQVPNKRELDLGSRLVFRFAEEKLPGNYEDIRDIFRRKGAYGRFKRYLAARNVLDMWYTFEAEATKQALIDWCQENGLEIDNS